MQVKWDVLGYKRNLSAQTRLHTSVCPNMYILSTHTHTHTGSRTPKHRRTHAHKNTHAYTSTTPARAYTGTNTHTRTHTTREHTRAQSHTNTRARTHAEAQTPRRTHTKIYIHIRRQTDKHIRLPHIHAQIPTRQRKWTCRRTRIYTHKHNHEQKGFRTIPWRRNVLAAMPLNFKLNARWQMQVGRKYST